MNNSVAESDVPTALFSDYVEMTYLSFVMFVGVPINLHVLFKLLKQKQKSACYSVKRGFLLMKINLNISDILILFINAGGKLGWLITYQWIAGDLFCRLFKYLSIGSLYLSSNIVTMIALDRLRTVLSAQRREHTVLPTKIILCFAWLLALVSSIPQFFVFRTFDVLQFSDESWYQCTDIWTVQDHLVSTGVVNLTNDFPFTDSIKNLHELSHLFMVFYGPLIIMGFCYFFITVKLTKYSKGHPQDSSRKTTDTLISTRNLKLSVSAPAGVSKIRKFSNYKYSELEPKEVSPKFSLNDTPPKSTNKLVQFLKNEFSYCFCIKTKEINQKLSNRNPITEDGLSMYSLGSGSLFTWTPTIGRRKGSLESQPGRKLSSHRDFFQKFSWKKENSKENLKGICRQPAWRRQLRSRVFKTTLLVVLTHIIFWLPYNFISLLRFFVSIDSYTMMRNHMNVFEDMQFLIALINPFLYCFSESLAKY